MLLNFYIGNTVAGDKDLSHSAANSAKDKSDLGISTNSSDAKIISVLLVNGYTISTNGEGNDLVLKDKSNNVIVVGKNLDNLKTKIGASDKLSQDEKTKLSNQLKNGKVIENVFLKNVCRPSRQIIDIEVQPKESLIEFFDGIRNGDSEKEVIYKFNSLNDNIGHGAGRAAGLKEGTRFEGNDEGLTFGLELQRLVKEGDDSYSYSLLNHLYTRSVQVRGASRNAKGAYYQEALEQSAFNVSIVKSQHSNGRAAYFFRYEGEVGCQVDKNGVSEGIQKVWHEDIGDGRKLENTEHMDNLFYLAGKIGPGVRATLYEDGTSSLSALVETGAQLSTRDSKDNAVYCSGKLIYEGKYCELELYGATNSSGHYKVGGGVAHKIFKNASLTAGGYYIKNEQTKTYGDSDLITEIGFKFGGK